MDKRYFKWTSQYDTSGIIELDYDRNKFIEKELRHEDTRKMADGSLEDGEAYIASIMEVLLLDTAHFYATIEEVDGKSLGVDYIR